MILNTDSFFIIIMKEKKNDKHQRIIQAATKIIAQKGFFQAKVSDIAKEARVADGTIYNYFENKDDILISLFEKQMQFILDYMKSQVSKEKDIKGKLEKFALIHLQLIENNIDIAEIIQIELRQSGRFMKEYKNEKFAEYLDIIGNIIREGQESGVVKKDVIPSIAKRAFFGALDEISRVWVLSSRKRYDIETAARQISDYFLTGLFRQNDRGDNKSESSASYLV